MTYLPLTAQIVTVHLAGEIALGLYRLQRDDTCHWPAAARPAAGSV